MYQSAAQVTDEPLPSLYLHLLRTFLVAALQKFKALSWASKVKLNVPVCVHSVCITGHDIKPRYFLSTLYGASDPEQRVLKRKDVSMLLRGVSH